jgi:hypothetical protein
MESGKTTLRWLIGKWLGASATMPARITRMARSHRCRGGCVRVEVAHASGPLAMFFFRHDDGSWWVVPQLRC